MDTSLKTFMDMEILRVKNYICFDVESLLSHINFHEFYRNWAERSGDIATERFHAGHLDALREALRLKSAKKPLAA